MAKGNPGRTTTTGTQGPEAVSSGLDRVREAAKKDSKQRFTNLMHHITIDLLRESYLALKRSAAPGLDGVTWEEYGEGLEERLPDLHERIQSGRYRAKPSKRAWIPKPDGTQRPIGVAAMEDKVVQQALVQVLHERGGRSYRLCYWAVREVGMTTTGVAGKLGISQSAVSRLVVRGEHFAAEKGWQLQ